MLASVMMMMVVHVAAATHSLSITIDPSYHLTALLTEATTHSNNKKEKYHVSIHMWG